MKKSDYQPPEAGAVFAIPLANGRFGACRVIRRMTDEEAKEFGAVCWLVAATAWSGLEIPDISEPELRSVLHLTHHLHKNQPEYFWVEERSPIPSSYIRIGAIEPAAAEKSLACYRSGGWGGLPIQILLQWRWDHDRESLEREEQEQQKQQQTAKLAAVKQSQERLNSITLQSLKHKKQFTGWSGHVKPELIKKSQDILDNTVHDLLQLGPESDEAAKMKLLQQCIEEFNLLNEQNSNFITTIEREDICTEFEEIAYACGLGQYDDLADRWRDW